MGFWFEHIPISYPSYQDVLDRAGELAMDGDPREGINHVLGVVGNLPSSPIKDDYSGYVRFRFAETQLLNPMITSAEKIGVFTALFAEPTADLANAIADTGKDWSRLDTEDDRQIGWQLLKYAASIFEKVVSNLDEQMPIDTKFRIVVEDYARVAALQDEAGDKDGMAETAEMVAPHLLELAKDKRLDKIQKSGLSTEMQLTALQISEKNPTLVDALVAAMSKKNADITKEILRKRKITALIDSAGEDTIDGLLRSFGDEPDFDFWHRLHDLVKENADTPNERAQCIVNRIDTVFPTLFEEANEKRLTMLPVEQVLFFTNRDDLLAKYYKSVVRGQKSVHMMSKFAGECGVTNAVARFNTMVKVVGLNKEESRVLYEMYFEPERDKTNANNSDD